MYASVRRLAKAYSEEWSEKICPGADISICKRIHTSNMQLLQFPSKLEGDSVDNNVLMVYLLWMKLMALFDFYDGGCHEPQKISGLVVLRCSHLACCQLCHKKSSLSALPSSGLPLRFASKP
jgi:hypothetical protein